MQGEGPCRAPWNWDMFAMNEGAGREGGAAHRPHTSAAARFARAWHVGARAGGTGADRWPRKESMVA